MNGYLLDTSVLSTIAPGKPALSPGQVEWFRRENERLFVPTVAIAEIFDGIAKLRRSGATARADGLASWMDALAASYGERVLVLDAEAAKRTGELSDAVRALGRHPGFPDVAIAAIADANGLTIATRNLRHFEAIGIDCIDPFAQGG